MTNVSTLSLYTWESWAVTEPHRLKSDQMKTHAQKNYIVYIRQVVPFYTYYIYINLKRPSTLLTNFLSFAINFWTGFELDFLEVFIQRVCP